MKNPRTTKNMRAPLTAYTGPGARGLDGDQQTQGIEVFRRMVLQGYYD